MKKFGFIGCGNMGGALASAVAKTVSGDDLLFCDASLEKAKTLASNFNAQACEDAKIVAMNCQYIFLGVKPQGFDGLFADLTVRDKIKNSIASVCGIESQIRSVIIKLESDIEATKIKRENAQKYINEIALKS